MIDTKALREKVLDLAIRGKLVPQDPNDEPASVLLERIRAEKEQMVKDGKLKAKDIKNDTIIFKGDDNLHYEQFPDGTVKCIEEEIPFELPQGWAWCRFSSAFIINPRNQLSDDMSVSFVPMPLIQEGYANKHTDEEKIWGSVKSGFTHFANNDVGIAKITPCFENKKSVVFKGLKNGYGAGTTELHIIRTIGNLIYPEYVLWNVKTDAFISNGIKAFSGAVGQKRIGKDFIEKSLIPIAPTNEQKRILELISIAFEYLDSIETSKEAFKVDIQSIKSKILALAIRGKLVPQNPDDEPASVLLERIRAEKEQLIKHGKIKCDKKESVIFKGEDNSYYEKIGNNVVCIDEEIPFELPDSWCWCRLGTIFSHNTGKALNSSNTDGCKLTYITTSNLYWDRFELATLKEMFFVDSEIDKCTVKKGDLLVCEGGDIGRAAIWTFDEDIRIQNHIHRLRPYISLSNRFYYYVMFLWKQFGFVGGQGIGLQGFSSNALHHLIVPLPPLNEQSKIVEFVDNLNKTIANIEKSLS